MSCTPVSAGNVMDHLLISLADEEIKDNRVVDVFERRLKRSLNEKNRITGLLLRPEQRATSTLLDWLEQWTREFEAVGRSLFVIPVTREQFEVLEISHPDQRLVYYSSVEEWNAAFPDVTGDTPASVLSPPAAPVEAETPSTPDASAGFPASAYTVESLSDQPEVAPGTCVEISGEYVCAGCGIQRTWLKGDILEPCDNVECMNNAKGWRLSCDLF